MTTKISNEANGAALSAIREKWDKRDTPMAVACQLVKLANLQHGQVVLEPSAGRGNLVAAILDPSCTPDTSVLAVEREPGYAEALRQRFPDNRFRGMVTVYEGDFLVEGVDQGSLVDSVVMSPPFVRENGKDHMDHVRIAYALLNPGDGRLVSVLPKSVDLCMDRRHHEFREWFKEHEGYTIDLPKNAFVEPGVRTVVLVMRAGKP